MPPLTHIADRDGCTTTQELLLPGSCSHTTFTPWEISPGSEIVAGLFVPLPLPLSLFLPPGRLPGELLRVASSPRPADTGVQGGKARQQKGAAQQAVALRSICNECAEPCPKAAAVIWVAPVHGRSLQLEYIEKHRPASPPLSPIFHLEIISFLFYFPFFFSFSLPVSTSSIENTGTYSSFSDL